jgi:hypothetical protein
MGAKVYFTPKLLALQNFQDKTLNISRKTKNSVLKNKKKNQNSY